MNESPNDESAGWQNSDWTQVLPTANTRVAYVSATGNDGTGLVYVANTFTNPWVPPGTILPFLTIAAAVTALLASGGTVGDKWCLMKKGDTFTDQVLPEHSGASAAAPWVYGYYWWTGASSARPILELNGTAIHIVTTVHHDIQIHGLDFYAYKRDLVGNPADYDAGAPDVVVIENNSAAHHILVEDCMARFCNDGFIIDGGNLPINNSHDFVFNRCVVVDSYGGTSLGIWAIDSDDMTIDGCVFDHNGWLAGTPPPDTQSRNFYISDGTEGFTIRNTIGARSASDAIQMRAGGTCHDNLFFRHNTGINCTENPSTITNNVVLEGATNGSAAVAGQMALESHGTGGTTIVSGNIIAHLITDAGTARAFNMNSGGFGSHDFLIENNVVYNVRRGILVNGVLANYSNIIFQNNYFYDPNDNDEPLAQIDDVGVFPAFTFINNHWFRQSPATWWELAGTPSNHAAWISASGETAGDVVEVTFLDPTRTVATYHASLGLTGTNEAFLAEARQQSRHFWRDAYYAPNVNAWIRTGYTITTSFELDQLAFRHRNDDGGEGVGGATWGHDLNEDWTQLCDVNFRVRFEINNGGSDGGIDAHRLQYRVNGIGSWFHVNTATEEGVFVRTRPTTGLNDGGDCTQQISGIGIGGFIDNNNGQDDTNGQVGPCTYGSAPSFINVTSEAEFCLDFVSGDFTDGDFVELRLVRSDGSTPFTSYSNIPLITVSIPTAPVVEAIPPEEPVDPVAPPEYIGYDG